MGEGKDWKEALRSWGAKPDEAIERLAYDESFYLRLLKELKSEGRLEELESLVQSKSYIKAFRLSHEYKGVAANLSLNPLYNSLYELTEALRGRAARETDTDAEATDHQTAATGNGHDSLNTPDELKIKAAFTAFSLDLAGFKQIDLPE